MWSDIRKILITAGITFLFTGICTTLFVRFLDRPKPVIAIKSVLFDDQATNPVELNTEILSYDRELMHPPYLSKYTPFKILLARDNELSIEIQKLENAKTMTENWIEEYGRNNKDNPHPRLSYKDLQSIPFIIDVKARDIILKALLAGDLAKPPVNISSLKDITEIAAFYIDQDMQGKKSVGIRTTMGSMTLINLYGVTSKQNRDQFNLLYSVLGGVGENLLYYHKGSIDRYDRLLVAANNYRKQLRNLLPISAKLSIIATIYNAGKSSILLQPGFMLLIDQNELVDKEYNLEISQVIEARQSQKDEYSERILGELNRFYQSLSSKPLKIEEGSQFIAAPFFSQSSPIPNLSIQPGEAISVRLTTEKQLGNAGSKIKSIYDTGLIRCSVIGHSIDGRIVRSPLSKFGKIPADSKPAN
jgi:hypothetical protein